MEHCLNKLYIIGISDNIPLSGNYDEQKLIDIMIKNWITYFECHKCGKWDYCKYVQQHPTNPNKSINIKCGIAIDFITNFINTTFSSIGTLSKSKKQSYLNSAYYLTCFTQNSEQLIGAFIDKDFINHWGTYSTATYGILSKETLNLLNKAHSEMKNIPFFKSEKSVLFVEGRSEEIFANNFSDIEVENYEGQGRITYAKVEYLFKKYKDRGYKIYLQADKDGKINNENINKIISKELIPEENIFCFDFDFETAIPIRLFYQLVYDNKIITDSYDDFRSGYNNISIVKYIEKRYSIILPKPLISTKLCEYIDTSSREKNLFYSDDFLGTEIGKFWYFLKTKVIN